jgi:DNA-binding transcriptional LysR family regulator
MTKTPPGALVIGATPLAGANSALATALAELRQQMPRLGITIETGTRQQIATAVARGELDLAVIDGLTAPGDPLPERAPVTAFGLSEKSVRVVLPADHPLAARTTLCLPDLADARWIEAENVAPPLAEIRRHARTEGFRAALRYTGADVTSLISLAAAGHGLTLLPETVLRAGSITSVHIALPRLYHRVELIHTALPKGSAAAALSGILSRH